MPCNSGVRPSDLDSRDQQNHLPRMRDKGGKLQLQLVEWTVLVM
jgi:hypothetical protein